MIFTNGSVSDYSTLVFLHTTGDFLVEEEFDGLYNYLVNGGTWLGIHSGPLLTPGPLCGWAWADQLYPISGRLLEQDASLVP